MPVQQELMPKLQEMSLDAGSFKEMDRAREHSDAKHLNAHKRAERVNSEKITAAPAITNNAVTVTSPGCTLKVATLVHTNLFLLHPYCFPRDFTCFELCFQNHFHPNNPNFKEPSSNLP